MAHGLVVKRFAFLADDFQDAQYGVRVTIHKSGNGANTQTLGQQFDDLNHFITFQAQAVQWLLFGIGFSASLTAETADDAITVLEFGEILGFAATAQARCHFGLDFLSAKT
jgi:hypothetical protein